MIIKLDRSIVVLFSQPSKSFNREMYSVYFKGMVVVAYFCRRTINSCSNSPSVILSFSDGCIGFIQPAILPVPLYSSNAKKDKTPEKQHVTSFKTFMIVCLLYAFSIAI